MSRLSRVMASGHPRRSVQARPVGDQTDLSIANEPRAAVAWLGRGSDT